MFKLLWRLYEAVAMVIGLGALGLLCLAWTPFAMLLDPLLPAPTATRIGRRAIHSVFRFYVTLLQLLCACRFDLRAVDELARERRPMVIVANHPSLLDAVILVSRLPNAVCVMKGTLARNLFLGAGARMARYIVNDAPLPMVRSAIDELRGGAVLVLFPEGTRTATPPVGPCAPTGGLIAARAGVPVQTLLIDMSTRYLGKGWPLWRPPQLPLTVRVRRGPRFERVEQPQRFGAEIEALLRRELGAPDAAPPAAPLPADTIHG